MTGDPFWQVIDAQQLDVAPAVLSFHAGRGTCIYSGRCDITRGRHPLVRLGLWVAGFPRDGCNLPTRVTTKTQECHSIWERDFGGHVTRSRLTCNPSRTRVIEAFGPFSLTLSLRAENGQLHISVESMRIFRLPVPTPLVPVSTTTEAEGADGRFLFDVAGRIPGIGPLIRYRGDLRRT
ncbi:DUF4166 domain-containing protein [Roseovarius sp. CAU 1744]|uniref:DUF4166 domain-containing protein n=1 Tax=Roseovarius sp. CAU 1744 TaxID=3140368 RepID=UPI00325ADE17